MTYNDWIGTIGVGLILLAYFLNTVKGIPTLLISILDVL